MCERDIDEKHVHSRLTHIFVSQADSTLLDNPSPHNNCYFLIISFSLFPFFHFISLFMSFHLYIYTCCNWKEDASFCCCCRHNMILSAVNEHFCIFVFCSANAELKAKEKREAATLARATS